MLHRVSWSRDILRRKDIFEVFTTGTCMDAADKCFPERVGDFNQ